MNKFLLSTVGLCLTAVLSAQTPSGTSAGSRQAAQTQAHPQRTAPAQARPQQQAAQTQAHPQRTAPAQTRPQQQAAQTRTTPAEKKVRYAIKAGYALTFMTAKQSVFSSNVYLKPQSNLYVGLQVDWAFSRHFHFQPEVLFTTQGASLVADLGKMAPEDILLNVPDWGLPSNPEKPKWVDLSQAGKVKAKYVSQAITVPLLVKYASGFGLEVSAGPYLSHLISQCIRFDTGNAASLTARNGKPLLDHDRTLQVNRTEEAACDAAHKYFRKFDVGAAASLAYMFPFGGFVEARYQISALNKSGRAKDRQIDELLWGSRRDPSTPLGGTTIPRLAAHSVQIGIGYRFK